MTAASGAAQSASTSPLASSGRASGVGSTFNVTSRPSLSNSPLSRATRSGATYSALSVPVAIVSFRGSASRCGAGEPGRQRAGARSAARSAGSVQDAAPQPWTGRIVRVAVSAFGCDGPEDGDEQAAEASRAPASRARPYVCALMPAPVPGRAVPMG